MTTRNFVLLTAAGLLALCIGCSSSTKPVPPSDTNKTLPPPPVSGGAGGRGAPKTPAARTTGTTGSGQNKGSTGVAD